jgi:hypothetical protein
VCGCVRISVCACGGEESRNKEYVLKYAFRGPTEQLGQWAVVGHCIDTSAAVDWSTDSLLRMFAWMDISSCSAIDSYCADSRRSSNMRARRNDP